MMRFIRICMVVALCLFALTGKGHASADPDFTAFASWPVLHEGRLKTFESLARASLYQMAGETHVNDMDAIEWLAVTLFDPSVSVDMPVIRVERQSIIDLPDRATRLYSLNELMVAMRPVSDLVMTMQAVEPSKLSATQKELLTVYNAMVVYTQLVQSLGPILPLAGFDGSYSDGAGTEAQRELIAAAGADNQYLRFIPDDTNPNLPFISVWEAYLQNSDSPVLSQVKAMAAAWNDGDYKTWNTVSANVEATLKETAQVSWTLELERLYVAIDPVFWAMLAYLAGGLLVLRYPEIGGGVVVGGAFIHLFGLIARSIILMRPPTGTIYETFLFASMAIIGVALFMVWKNKNTLVFSASVLSAAFLLFISRGFIGGDSLSVLVAVLNTNFWLSTHVTCIIIGYALCVIAAVIGHLYLMTNHDNIKKLMIPMGLIALLFTSVGTLLGGIWADQSWGRFWGWDPKENGALLITLWLIWVLHGRISGHFNMVQMAAALGLTNIAVALTWFGVNLLGVGLHSYGFMAGIAYGLTAFCILQMAVIIGLYYWHKRRFGGA